MGLKDDIRPITQLKNHTAELVREVGETGRPMVITQNGEARAVLMDVEVFDRWRDALALLKLGAQGQADIKRDRTVSQAEAFQRAREAVERVAEDG
ncbi:MAG: type II toxin-antitoxin system Phd/YefM family antitoxin [Acidobacteriota bacterium]